MASDSELDKTSARVEETLRKSGDLDRQVSSLKGQREALLRQYGIDGDKISAYLVSGGEMTPQQRVALKKEQEQFEADLERDVQSAQDRFRQDQAGGGQKKPAPRRRRDMV